MPAIFHFNVLVRITVKYYLANISPNFYGIQWIHCLVWINLYTFKSVSLIIIFTELVYKFVYYYEYVYFLLKRQRHAIAARLNSMWSMFNAWQKTRWTRLATFREFFTELDISCESNKVDKNEFIPATVCFCSKLLWINDLHFN